MSWSSDKAEYAAVLKKAVTRIVRRLERQKEEIKEKEGLLKLEMDRYATLTAELEAIEFAIKELEK